MLLYGLAILFAAIGSYLWWRGYQFAITLDRVIGAGAAALGSLLLGAELLLSGYVVVGLAIQVVSFAGFAAGVAWWVNPNHGLRHE